MTDPALFLADLTSSFVRSAAHPMHLVSPCACRQGCSQYPGHPKVVLPPGLTGVGSLFRYLHMLVWDFLLGIVRSGASPSAWSAMDPPAKHSHIFSVKPISLFRLPFCTHHPHSSSQP
ncbi:hypothetical protein CORC01_11522 [Colletotrichum orchidophilum]|uniref:Uncharacterized protein n=1 Tax=Colletotrichum orchidophilum TaxID=1209926 RepID=A0A1G4AVS6_9PEZI|nr:uncharacterized protein CORC01_11522 [Colletotrichum orchidophilum]OHE93205.1 hypothetical protein CORC01_11522 [Colletotrichum orchidophilum]